MAHAKTLPSNNATKHDYIINEISSKEETSRFFYVLIFRKANKLLLFDLHLHVKVETVGDIPFFISTERNTFSHLLKTYKALEEQNAVPEEHRMSFTNCYGMGLDPTVYQETVILENFLAQGYRPYNRLESIEWGRASSAVTEMAKLQALSLAYKKTYPGAFGHDISRFQLEWEEGLLDHMMGGSVVIELNVMKQNHKEPLSSEKFSERYIKDLCSRLMTIVHGEFWGNNMLYRVVEDGKVEIKIVDLQTLQGGSPVTDLIYFIFTGSDEQFRARHFDQLVEHYYTQLCEAMRRLHLDPEEIFAREELNGDMKEKLPFGLTLGMFALPKILTSKTAHM